MLEQKLNYLVNQSRILGLPNSDLENASTMLREGEFEVCFDIIAEQMYEYDIKINQDFYDFAMEICKKLKTVKSYRFLQELIKS